jgi:hypothetical protein
LAVTLGVIQKGLVQPGVYAPRPFRMHSNGIYHASLRQGPIGRQIENSFDLFDPVTGNPMVPASHQRMSGDDLLIKRQLVVMVTDNHQARPAHHLAEGRMIQ